MATKPVLKPFWEIAIPRPDVIDGTITLDQYAADLHQAYKGLGSPDYTDPIRFFKKTYNTSEMAEIQRIVENRVNGKGGDPVIQIVTPFGGGKTHNLIALLHKSNALSAHPRIVVIVGNVLDATTPIWEELECQLTGECTITKGLTSPGRNKLEQFMPKDQPIVILMDEIVAYIAKASGIKVEESTLADQTNIFLQELSEYVGLTQKSVFVFTLPSNPFEQYGDKAKEIKSTLAALGRTMTNKPSVGDHDIPSIVQCRLFETETIDTSERQTIVDGYIAYLQKNNLIERDEIVNYKAQFIASYPFLPEVIDVLYKRWGTFPNFQRTRGLLRMLSIVMKACIDKKIAIPYISLADFDLENSAIAEELCRHLDSTYRSVMAVDITGNQSGVAKVDTVMKSIKNYDSPIGKRIATTIFMHSFGGGGTNGVEKIAIERSVGINDIPVAVINTYLDELTDRKLFHLQFEHGVYYFHTIANLNKLLFNIEDTVTDADRDAIEFATLKEVARGKIIKTYIWEEQTRTIPDNTDFKLIVLKNRGDKDFNGSDAIRTMLTIRDKIGDSNRKYRSNLFFVFPLVSEKANVNKEINTSIAYRKLAENTTLTDQQKQEVKKGIEDSKIKVPNAVLRKYRHIAILKEEVPSARDESRFVTIIDLDIPSSESIYQLDKVVYDRLKIEDHISETCLPVVIKNKYLAREGFASTKLSYDATFNVSSSLRFPSIDVFKKTINEGVSQQMFGLGKLMDGVPVYDEKWKKCIMSDDEQIILWDICNEQMRQKAEATETLKKESIVSTEQDTSPKEVSIEPKVATTRSSKKSSTIRSAHRQEIAEIVDESNDEPTTPNASAIVNHSLKLHISNFPNEGVFSAFMQSLKYLCGKFGSINIDVDCQNGSITQSETEDKVEENLNQSKIKFTITY